MIRDEIVSLAGEICAGRLIDEAVIGLGYTFVCLDNGACGLAYTLRDELERGCEAFGEAGNLPGRDLREVLSWIGAGSVIASSVGLAAANAVLRPPAKAFSVDLFDSLNMQAGDRVVTVGRFRPLEPALRKAGTELKVIEREDSPTLLSGCDVALISATSIINNTLESLLELAFGAREVVLLGPSTPYAPAAFASTPVTLIAGSEVSEVERVRRIVSEGGGTQSMGKSLSKWVLRVGKPHGT
jgi:uncharacterized protein (DUF4213/DUF364 family)